MQKKLQMKQFDSSQLGQFTGTSKYYKISRRHLLTDGTRYLAEQAACFWLMDAIGAGSAGNTLHRLAFGAH